MTPRRSPRDLIGGTTQTGDSPGKPFTVTDMETIVLRVRLTSGEHLDLRYEDPEAVDEDDLVDRVISVLSEDSGVLRCRHGDRLTAVFGRGVSTIEVSPRGAVL